MIMPLYEFQSDRAISDIQSDRLDRHAFVASLAGTIVSSDGQTATGVTVGLVGKWGEGKSSILHLLETLLITRHPDAVVVNFSPWLISQKQDLLHSFFNELAVGIQIKHGHIVHPGRISQLSEELTHAFADYTERLSPIFEMVQPGAGSFAKGAGTFFKALSQVYRNRRANDEKLPNVKRRIEALLTELSVPVIILVDEVDRIDNDDVRKLMHLVKAVADFPSISYVLAYDEARVAEALGFESPDPSERISRGRKYLEKIVQIPIQLPIVFNEELLSFLDEGIRKVVPAALLDPATHSGRRYAELRSLLIPHLVSTTREVRRLVAAFAHRYPLVADEVDFTDVLGFVELGICAPDLAECVRRTPDNFVFGPLLLAPPQNGDRDSSAFETIAKQHEHQPAIRVLFHFLFPSIARTKRLADCDPDQIALRRPLMTLLRLKALPDVFKRSDIASLLAMNQDQIYSALRTIVSERKISAFSQRLEEVTKTAPHANSAFVWQTLLQIIELASTEGMAQRLERRYAIREIVDALTALARRMPASNLNILAIVDFLIAESAFVAASMLIRSMRRRKQSHPEETTSAPTEIELSSLARRLVQKAKVEARIHQRLLHPFVVFLANEIGEWPPSQREKYSRHLRDSDAFLDEFVFEAFGGNYMIEGATIRELFFPDGDFYTHADRRLKELPEAAGIEMRQAYENLARSAEYESIAASTNS